MARHNKVRQFYQKQGQVVCSRHFSLIKILQQWFSIELNVLIHHKPKEKKTKCIIIQHSNNHWGAFLCQNLCFWFLLKAFLCLWFVLLSLLLHMFICSVFCSGTRCFPVLLISFRSSVSSHFSMLFQSACHSHCHLLTVTPVTAAATSSFSHSSYSC